MNPAAVVFLLSTCLCVLAMLSSAADNNNARPPHVPPSSTLLLSTSCHVYKLCSPSCAATYPKRAETTKAQTYVPERAILARSGPCRPARGCCAVVHLCTTAGSTTARSSAGEHVNTLIVEASSNVLLQKHSELLFALALTACERYVEWRYVECFFCVQLADKIGTTLAELAKVTRCPSSRALDWSTSKLPGMLQLSSAL